MKLLTADVSFEGNADGLVIENKQEIPDDYISQLKSDKIDTAHDRMGNFYRVCSVPVVVHERWLREGYDMSKEPARKTIQRLQNEHLDAFITTNKRI